MLIQVDLNLITLQNFRVNLRVIINDRWIHFRVFGFVILYEQYGSNCKLWSGPMRRWFFILSFNIIS